MDRRSWLWRRKSVDKSPAETETSASSASERFTDEQDTAKSSPKSTQSPEVSSKELEDDNNVKVKVLSERLSSVVLDIRAKDDLVKQHSKVAEEAVLGWEKAEKEIASLKTQLSAAAATNSALEDRLIHLDGALKECVRQLRRAKEDQDRTVQDALAQQARQWESAKTDLELRVVELTARLEAKSERSAAGGGEAGSSRLAALEKENSALKAQLLAKTEELELRTIEKELNRRAAETASKQQLEGIKKVAKLEVECRRLQAAAARRPSSNAELRRAPSSVCAESVTDCQSSECSDSWASALITELDQFRSDRGNASTRSAASLAAADIGAMDDFLEMERLAAANGDAEKGDAAGDDAAGSGQVAKLEEKAKKLAADKAEREKALHEAQRELRTSRRRAIVAEEKSAELQRLLNLANGEKHAMAAEVEAAEARRRELEGEVASLLEKGRAMEERLESEKTLTLELAAKYQDMEALGAEKRELAAQLEASRSEAKKLSEKVALLERKLEVEKALSIRLATKCHGVEALEAKKKGVELELESAREEIASLQRKMSSLELKVQEEKASCTELATRCEELEALCKDGDELGSQLESANSVIVELNEKVNMLEDVIEKNRPVTVELESQLESRQAEINSLKENVSLLEKKLESQKNLSAAYISALGASEDEKNKLAGEFELKVREAEELRGNVSLLEEQIHRERAQSSEFAAKYQDVEEQLSSGSLGNQPVVMPVAIKDLQIRKEKELAKAAGKLADCQKTIASLSSKLKYLADFDDFLPGTENEGASADAWDDGDLKLLNPASYPAQIGCLAVT
uniref:Filament-like plant protein 3 n=1 Tax=Arundo donax TaxID=35708 RepID=A0A0A9CSN7_ARUDO